MDLNRATIIGRLTRDPELRSIPSGKSVCSMSLATNRNWTDQQGQKQKSTEFHNIVLWGRLGEIASQYLRKGRQVYIDGRLQTREWTGKDGVKRYRTEIIGENLMLLDGGGRTPGEAPVTNGGSSIGAPVQEVVEEEIKVEDIPF